MMKKFNWGTGIAAVIVLFLAAMGFMLSIAMSHKTDLVADNYYERELKYQDRINSMQHAVNMPEAVTLVQSGDTLAIRLSPDAAAPGMSGSVHFYRPSDKQKDFDVRIALDPSGVQRIATGSMARGLWRVQVEWKSSAGEFYAEQPLVVN